MISKFYRNTVHLIASTFELFSNFITTTIGLLVIPCKWLLVYMPRYHWNIEVKIIIYRQKRLQCKAYTRTYTHTLCAIWRWHTTLDGCVVNVVVTRFIKCCCTFLKLTRGYTGVDMVSGRYILIAPAMGKLQNFLLIILCGNDRNSGFYDKSNAFIFFFILTKNLLRRRILFLVFLFCSCKVFFLHVLAACRRALKTKPLFRFLKEVTNLWSKMIFCSTNQTQRQQPIKERTLWCLWKPMK